MDFDGSWEFGDGLWKSRLFYNLRFALTVSEINFVTTPLGMADTSNQSTGSTK